MRVICKVTEQNYNKIHILIPTFSRGRGSSLAGLTPVQHNSPLWGHRLLAAGRVRSCCVTAVRVHASLFTDRRQRLTTHSAWGDPALLRKSQPRAGAGPSPIGPRTKVREDGDMATEPKTSHGHGDISCCREERPRCHGCTL